MCKRKQPKFKLGDVVVVLIYSNIGEITDVREFEKSYVYELDGGNEYYLESSLRLLSDKSDINNVEQINIDYKFSFGDIVALPNICDDLYKVVGFRTEIWRYQDEAWEDIIYELSRLHDGDWIECGEDEIELIQAKRKIVDLAIRSDICSNIKTLCSLEKKDLKSEMFQDLLSSKLVSVSKQEKIDQLLDLYNDYKELKVQFGDEEFQRILNIVKSKLSKLVNNT